MPDAVSSKTTGYDIRPYEDRDEDQVLALLQTTLAGGPTGKRTAEFFRWKHLHNPFGRSFGLVADDHGEVIGVRLLLRWRFRAGAGTVRAVRAVDTATHPAHQGRGVFTQLTLAALDALAGETQFVFNTPNANSLPGYRKMGWQPVGTVPITVGVQRPLRFLAGAASIARGEGRAETPACSLPQAAEGLRDETAVSALLAATHAAEPGRLQTDRSVAYLRWRYAAAPGLGYRAIAALADDGTLRGLAFARPRYRGRLRELTLSELLVASGDRRTAMTLLRRARRSGCDYVASHVPRSLSLPAVAAGYFRAPGHGMTLVARPLQDVDPDPTDLRSYALQLGDLEVF